jgi:hypothetical protein
MSDDNALAPGAMNLEGPQEPAGSIVGPPPIGATPAPVEPLEPPVAPVEPDEEPEGVVFDSKGQKLVPLSALQQTRTELKAAKALAGQVEQLKAAAEKGQELEGFIDNIRPLLARLRGRPDIVAAVMGNTQAPPPGPPSPYQPAPDPAEALLPKQDAEDLARTLELYTPEGSPDIARARKLAFFMRRTGGEEAQRLTAPMAQNLAIGQAGTLKQQYATIKDKHGRSVNPQVLNQMWSIVPPELVAQDPNVAGVLYYAAKGYAAHHGLEEPTPAPKAPLLSEPSGGRAPATTTLTDLDERFKKAMQITEKQYTEASGRYKPGAINVLE